jgi:uncharacterized protein with HEPN domain
MSLETWKFRVQHVLESAERIFKYTEGMSFEEFSNDTKTVDAVLRNIEIMGEAARYVPQEYQDQHPDVPWHEMIGMRNVIVHGYFKLELNIVWSTIQNDIFPLVPILKNITASFQDES